MHTAVEMRPTREVQGILQIVDGIYAAACGETTWQQAVADVCRLGKLDACVLSLVEPRERRRIVLASCGLRSCTKPGATLGQPPGNPLLTDSVLQSAQGAVWQDHEIMPTSLLAATSFWTDWMQPNGFVSWACVIIGRDQGRVACLEAYAKPGRGSICSEPVYLLRQLALHLSRAWRLGRTRGSTPQHGAESSAAASGLSCRTAATAAPAALPEVGRLRAEFGLTKAEARLALRLAEGSSLASAAQAFDVKLTTIRSQLQQAFVKTGTSRQAELVAMLLSRGYGTRRSS